MIISERWVPLCLQESLQQRRTRTVLFAKGSDHPCSLNECFIVWRQRAAFFVYIPVHVAHEVIPLPLAVLSSARPLPSTAAWPASTPETDLNCFCLWMCHRRSRNEELRSWWQAVRSDQSCEPSLLSIRKWIQMQSVTHQQPNPHE